MNKSMYTVDNSGYRQAIINKVESLEQGPAIFGGALYAYQYIEDNDLHSFCRMLGDVIFAVQFHRSEDCEYGIAQAMKIFCELCLVDYMLIEAYLGTSFNSIEDYVLNNCPMKPVKLVA